MRRFRTAALAAWIIGLSACSPFAGHRTNTDVFASPTPLARPGELTLQGQLGIKLLAFENLPAKGVSLGFFFNGNAASGQLDLMTPLGSQVARVRWTSAGASLQTDQGERRFNTPEELSAEVLGEALPLAALMSWVQGRPAPGLPDPTARTETSFEQVGWRIDASELGVGRLVAERPATSALRGATVRVRLDR